MASQSRKTTWTFLALFAALLCACAQARAQSDCTTATVLSSGCDVTVPGGAFDDGAVEEAGSCMGTGETQANWFVFTPTASGTFEFLITPSTTSNDYDFAMFDITTSYNAGGCVIAGATQLVCNYSGISGPTGVGCSFAPCVPAQNVIAGNTYAILVNLFTAGSTSGFDLTFGGTAVIGAGGSGSGGGSVSFTNTPVCVGQTASFTPSIVSSNFNYLWDFGSGVTSTLQSPQHAFTAPGNYPVTLTITAVNPTGCGDTATVTQNVFVSAPPGLSVSPTTSNTCPGQSVNLQATTGTTGPVFQWSPASGLSVTSGNAVVAAPLATTTYTVVVTNANGCTAQATAVINVGSTFTLNTTPSFVTICPGEIAGLSASGADTYAWSPSAGLDVSTGSTVQATPSATTSYTVTGSDNAGCQDTAIVVVTVSALPVIGIAPANPVICAGQSEALTASGAVDYEWSPVTGLGVATGATVTASPPANATYTVTGTSADGCTASQTVALQVLTSPTLSVSPSTPAVCNGESADLTASGATDYEWTPATGLNVSTGPTVTASPAATTTYTVTGTVAAGCTAEGTVVVSVGASPVVTVNPANPVVCEGESVSLSASGAVTYAWSPNTSLSTSAGASVISTPLSAIAYTVTGTNAAGCTAAATTTVSVNAPPTVSVTAGDSSLCPGEGTTLYANGAAQYAWQPGSGSGAVYVINPTTGTTFTVTGTDAAGCSAQATLTVGVLNVAPVTGVNATGLVCAGDSAVLQATGSADYAWQPEAGLNQTFGSNVIASPFENTTYTVTSIDASGCISSDTVAVLVDALPVAAFTLAPQSGCDPLTVTFTNASANAATSVWIFGDGTTSSIPAPSHTYSIGAYLPWLVVTNAAGCSDTVQAADSVLVYGPPEALFSVSPDTGVLIGYADATFAFTNLSDGATAYAWDFDDGNTSTQFEPEHTYLVEGNYDVTLVATSEHGCASLYTLGPLMVDGVPPLFIPNTFTPNNDGINDEFRIYGIAIQSIQLSVFDRWGTLLFESTELTRGWNGTFKGHKMQQGVYVYQAKLVLTSGKKLLKYGDVTLLR